MADDKIRTGTLAQASVKGGGWYDGRCWLTRAQARAAERRWAIRSYAGHVEGVTSRQGTSQCGGCRFFAAFGTDYGICYREGSEFDGMITFEHGACRCCNIDGQVRARLSTRPKPEAT